jgi:hypothetical protein
VCSDASNAVLLQKNYCSQTQKRPKNARRNARETLKKRSRYRPVLHLDALNQQRWWCGQLATVWGGGLAQAWVCLPGVPTGKR